MRNLATFHSQSSSGNVQYFTQHDLGVPHEHSEDNSKNQMPQISQILYTLTKVIHTWSSVRIQAFDFGIKTMTKTIYNLHSPHTQKQTNKYTTHTLIIIAKQQRQQPPPN